MVKVVCCLLNWLVTALHTVAAATGASAATAEAATAKAVTGAAAWEFSSGCCAASSL